MYPSKIITIFRFFWRYVPMSVLRFIEYIPTRENRRFRRTTKVINKLAQQLIHEKTEGYQSGMTNKSKDIMSILGRFQEFLTKYCELTTLTDCIVAANTSENPETRLSKEEMIAQMGTLLFAGQYSLSLSLRYRLSVYLGLMAGHDTTSLTLTWLLWELAKNPEYQSRMRAEISTIRAKVAERGDSDFAMVDMEAMTFVGAAIKVSYCVSMNDVGLMLTWHS